MRVISGKYRGRQLKSPTSDNVRPTGDKVKQALFTKFQFDIQDSIFLDLFAGSGSIGIEAISRGAKKVYFVDKDKKSISLVYENLKGIKEDYKVIHLSYDVALQKLDEKFDFIFIDPPYANGLYDNALDIIYNRKLLADDGVIICEHLNGLQLNTKFNIVEQKRYGTVTLSFLKL